jgi:hypothetical protein
VSFSHNSAFQNSNHQCVKERDLPYKMGVKTMLKKMAVKIFEKVKKIW